MRPYFLALFVLQLALSPFALAKHHHAGPSPSPVPAPSPSPTAIASPDPTAAPSPTASAAALPDCLDDQGAALPIDDAQVLQWKNSTPNQYLARAHVRGTLVRQYADHSGHAHFSIQLGAAPGDTLEVIYNLSFGNLPALAAGMEVEACGDYITSDAPSGPYPASPDGAIIHWVHRNPGGGHASGFVAIDGQLYGQGSGNGGS